MQCKFNLAGANKHRSWDKEEYKYKLVESLTPPDEETEYDQYIFVVRTRIGESPSPCANPSLPDSEAR